MRRGIREVEKKRETGGRSLYSVMYAIHSPSGQPAKKRVQLL